MDINLFSKLNVTKKKVGAFLVVGLSVGLLSVGTVLAAESNRSISIEEEDGVVGFSVDDGQTWSEEIPEGLTVIDEGNQQIITEGDLFDVSGNDAMAPLEEGEIRYSLDGGETWIVTESNPEQNTGSIETKIVDGVLKYSTDGGDTWITDPAN
ncbi:MAG TPA: sialidase family protein [Virgibacillus sp.]|nr:sialidase family protein [Virgibacillus sp.]HLR67224.1 sialidase family protein [Virgibacillus sp.]